MTLDQCYNTYKGTVVLVDGNPADAGQCVQWADTVLAHVYGFVTHYGNAIDWWNDPGDLLTDGFQKISDGSVRKGDFVVFNTKVGSVYGHIDVAMADGSTANFLGADSNWNKDLTVHEVQHSNASYVLGSLRLKGGDVNNDTVTQLQAIIVKLQSALNVKTKDADVYESAMNEARSHVTELEAQLKQAANPTKLSPGLYQVS